MDKTIAVAYDNKVCYHIVIRQDFDALGASIDVPGIKERKIAILTDSNVGPLYGKEVAGQLEKYCKKVYLHTFMAGEENKTLETVEEVYTFLIENGFDRKDLLLALGGGVVGDLCGYAAATYLRGIDFIQVPTTLLSQVDSSIGGKTGVDFDQYKNMVGAFHMPRLVYMNLSVLETLEKRQFASGMGEIIKHGLIKDASYFTWLMEQKSNIEKRDMDTLVEMVLQSCLIKRSVVERDPKEQGERAYLNFGHTLGHAIEKYKNFSMLHGECVAAGCVAAAYLSLKRGCLLSEEYDKIRESFRAFGLPVKISGIRIEEIIQFTKSDKKMEAGKIKFILLQKLGQACIDTSVSEEEMREALCEICEEGVL